MIFSLDVARFGMGGLGRGAPPAAGVPLAAPCFTGGRAGVAMLLVAAAWGGGGRGAWGGGTGDCEGGGVCVPF